MAAFLEYVELQNARQWPKLYERLHPAQQRLLSDEEFRVCLEDQVPSGFTVEVDSIGDPHWVRSKVYGVRDTVRTLAIPYQGSTQSAGERQPVAETVTSFSFTRRRWRFALHEVCG